MSATCRTCSAPILWRLTTNGRPMPVDAEPVEGGNLELDDDERTVRVVDPAQPSLDPRPRHTSHFATCPDADEHRAPR